MAIAEVYYPNAMSMPVDDSSISFPRAPPPSPEMQPRGLSRIFEFPASKLEGIGVDLRRNTFAFDEERSDENCHYPTRRKLCESIFPDSDPYEDDYIACSPRKRVCCASSMALPEDHMITTMSSSGDTSSLASSGFGSFHDVSRRGMESAAVGGIGLDMNITNGTQDPGMFSEGLRVQSKPHFIPPRTDGGAVVMRDPFSPSYFTDDNYAQNMLSRSFDLYATHPHLPHSFETTQLPEVRPGRSRTLDTASLHKTLLPCPQAPPEYNLEVSQRKRKVSVKRKNPDESENDPLQFSFDYSYSSTGSSGENDWVLVDRQPEGIWPLEKKPCSGDQSFILAPSMQQQPYVFNNHQLFGHSAEKASAPLEVPRSITISPSFSPFVKVDVLGQHEVETSKDSTPTQRQAMDVGLDLGCSEEAEKMEMEDESESFQQHNGMVELPLVLRPHPPGFQMGVAAAVTTGQGQAPGLLSIPARHSCMEGFLHQQSKSARWWGTDRDGEQVLMDGETEARLSLSKSL